MPDPSGLKERQGKNQANKNDPECQVHGKMHPTHADEVKGESDGIQDLYKSHYCQFPKKVPAIGPEQAMEYSREQNFDEACQDQGNAGKTRFGQDIAVRVMGVQSQRLEKQDEQKDPDGDSRGHPEIEPRVIV